MARRIQEPIITEEMTAHVDYRAEHPAFGQIIVTRQSSSHGNYLYGTDHHHTYTYCLKIDRSEMIRHLSNDRYHSGAHIVEIEMTEAQFNGLSSYVGYGEGVPCTIRYTEKDGLIPGLPRPAARVDQFRKEIEQAVTESDALLLEAIKQIEELPISQKKKDGLVRSLGNARGRLVNSAAFVAEQFEEHVTTVTEEAKQALAASRNRGVLPSQEPESMDGILRDERERAPWKLKDDPTLPNDAAPRPAARRISRR